MGCKLPRVSDVFPKSRVSYNVCNKTLVFREPPIAQVGTLIARLARRASSENYLMGLGNVIIKHVVRVASGESDLGSLSGVAIVRFARRV